MVSQIEQDSQKFKKTLVGDLFNLETKAPWLLRSGAAIIPSSYGKELLNLMPSNWQKEHLSPLINLDFAIRTILEAREEKRTSPKVNSLSQETIRNYLFSCCESLELLKKIDQDEVITWPLFVNPELPQDVHDFFLAKKGLLVSWHSGNSLATTEFFQNLLQHYRISPEKIGIFMESQPAPSEIPIKKLINSVGIQPIVVSPEKGISIEMVRVLNQVDILIALFDRPPKDTQQGVTASLFGKPACFPIGPAHEALHRKCPILPFAIVRDKIHYTVKFGQVVDSRDFMTERDKVKRYKDLTQAIVKEMEGLAGIYPTSFYSWFEPLWLEER